MSRTAHDLRATAAEAAFRALGPSPARHRLLAVHCASGHHVAGVYRTPEGLVFAAGIRAHGHGDRDRHDAAHHGGHRDELWFDWLDDRSTAPAEDALPAGCECGPRTLSRRLVRRSLGAGEHRLVVD